MFTPLSAPRLVLACFLLVAVPSVSQAQTGAPDLNLSYESFTLDNGLKVIVHEDHKAPIVAVSVWYHVGSKNEPAGQTGFAHLFEHLMFNGSENYDGEWFEPMGRVGATGMNGTTWLDRTNYFQNVPTPALDLALWMESDRMGHLLGAVTQEKLDNQRGVVQNEKRQGDNQPYGRVNYNLYEGLFPPGHPYRHSTIGSMDDLNAASLEDVQQWFRDYYGPNNAVLSLAGDIDLATAKEKVQLYFGDIPAGPEVDAVQTWVPKKLNNTTETQYDTVPAILANRAWVAPPRNTRDKAMLDLATAILGGSDNSYLYLELVYERQLASAVNFAVTPFELASVLDLSVTLNPGESVEIATEAMNRMINEFREEGPSEEEVQRAITTINAATIRGLEKVGSYDGKAAQLAEGELYAGDPLFINQYLAWINSATAKDVKDAARDWMVDGWHQVNVVPARTLSATGQGVDRSSGLPELPQNLPELTFPEIQRATLSNGIEVILAQRSTVPVVSLSMQFDAGYAADSGSKLGVSSFAAAMLEKGTRTKSALVISDLEERLGAEITAGANLDASFVNLSALKSNLDVSIALWADMIQNPAFDQVEVERLKTQRINAIAQEKAQPVGLALRLLPPILYGPDHAYGVPLSGSGTEDSITSINADDLRGFSSVWIRPDNARLFVVGDTTLEEIVPVLERNLRRWQAPQTPKPVKNIATVNLPGSDRVILIDKPGSPQSFILAGQVVPGLGTAQDLALEAMNDVLGGTFTARVNMNLREDKGWSYGAQTILQGARGQRPFLVYAPVQTDKTGDSLRELVMELDTLKTTRPVTQEEMDKVVAGSTRELPGQFETGNAVLNSLVSSDRYGRPLDYPAQLTEAYRALELPDLQNATSILQPEALVWIIVGDLAQIRSQVEALQLAPIEVFDENGNAVGAQ